MPGRTEEPFGRGQTILLLSNGREQLLHDEEILAALGYEPVGFLHSEDAIAACGSTPARFDGILVGCALSEEKARRLPAVLHAPRTSPADPGRRRSCQRHLMSTRWWRPAFLRS